MLSSTKERNRFVLYAILDMLYKQATYVICCGVVITLLDDFPSREGPENTLNNQISQLCILVIQSKSQHT